jgi:hypothetical protein
MGEHSSGSDVLRKWISGRSAELEEYCKGVDSSTVINEIAESFKDENISKSELGNLLAIYVFALGYTSHFLKSIPATKNVIPYAMEGVLKAVAFRENGKLAVTRQIQESSLNNILELKEVIEIEQERHRMLIEFLDPFSDMNEIHVGEKESMAKLDQLIDAVETVAMRNSQKERKCKGDQNSLYKVCRGIFDRELDLFLKKPSKYESYEEFANAVITKTVEANGVVPQAKTITRHWIKAKDREVLKKDKRKRTSVA